MAAAYIAVRNARARKNMVPSKEAAAKRRAQAEKHQNFWAELERQNKIAAIIKKYDKAGNGKLDIMELSMMLQDLAGGEAPTEEECSWVLNVADHSDKKIDGYIGKEELEVAINVWKNYLNSKPEIEEKFAKYDINHSGKLEIDQLKALLTDLNDGKPPPDAEVLLVVVAS